MSPSTISPLTGDRPHSWYEDSGLQVAPGQDHRATSDEKMFIADSNSTEKIPQYPSYTPDHKWDYQASRGSHPQSYSSTTAPLRDSTYPEAVFNPAPRDGAYNAGAYGGESPYSQQTCPPQKKILGLRRRWFFVGLVAVIVIIALGVGLGVYFDQKAHRTQSVGNAATPTAKPAAATTTTGPSLTTQTIALPSATLLSDCPSSNNTVQSVDVNGMSYQFRKACGASLYNPSDPDANVTGAALSLNECIGRCASANVAGSLRCDRVCWKNSKATDQTGGAGNCFGYIGTNTTDTNQVVGNLSGTTDCDGAFLMAVTTGGKGDTDSN